MGLRSLDYRALPRLFRRRRLLIIGCGDIGQRIVALCAKDWRVFGIGRSASTLERIRAAGAVPLKADPPHRRLQDLDDWVVHSAPPPLDERRQGGGDVDRLTRRWSARLLDRPRRRSMRANRKAERPPRRLVYLSTTGVYGDRQGQWTDEVCAVTPITDRARRRVDAERCLRDAARRSASLRVTTLRVPGIYAIDRLPIRRLQDRLPALLPQDDVQTSHIEAEDLARLTRIALMRGRNQRKLNVVDDSALPMGEYLDMVARWAGLPLPPRVDRETLLASVSPMRASFMSESRRLCNLRMKRELKLPLRYPTVADFLASHPAPQPAPTPEGPGGAPI
ncbi:MAG TPA: SDR family NAD(P)-dependent oxidoreductase [Lautropia sp.]|nr:SDR family NAD(P)-dependent oxidoreductase [Lautropia sp.]